MLNTFQPGDLVLCSSHSTIPPRLCLILSSEPASDWYATDKVVCVVVASAMYDGEVGQVQQWLRRQVWRVSV